MWPSKIYVEPHQPRRWKAPSQLGEECGISTGDVKVRPSGGQRHPRGGPPLHAPPANVQPVNVSQDRIGIPGEPGSQRSFARQEPDARLWVVGAIVHGILKDKRGKHLVPKWTNIRKSWIPPVDSDGRHALFTSGKVGTGMFIYHKECFECIGPLPDWANHNAIADGIDEWLELEPGTTGYGSDRSKSPRGHVGNPFGDDHGFFMRLCQFYRVHAIQAALYVHYVR